jgi:hypothetical protein
MMALVLYFSMNNTFFGLLLKKFLVLSQRANYTDLATDVGEVSAKISRIEGATWLA